MLQICSRRSSVFFQALLFRDSLLSSIPEEVPELPRPGVGASGEGTDWPVAGSTFQIGNTS